MKKHSKYDKGSSKNSIIPVDIFDDDDSLTLREKSNKKHTGLAVKVKIYITMFISFAVVFIIQKFDHDLAMNLYSELAGICLAIFVIERLINHEKEKRWKLVHKSIDYLIGRSVNRIRDGVASRIFSFQPIFDKNLSEKEIRLMIRSQREVFLNTMIDDCADELTKKMGSSNIFNEDNHDYFYEKAEEIWNIFNMKYAEYLEEDLVLLLIELHTNLIDACAHIRLYEKAKRNPQHADFYHRSGKSGLVRNMKEIIAILITLKEQGYSDIAKVLHT